MRSCRRPSPGYGSRPTVRSRSQVLKGLSLERRSDLFTQTNDLESAGDAKQERFQLSGAFLEDLLLDPLPDSNKRRATVLENRKDPSRSYVDASRPANIGKFRVGHFSVMTHSSPHKGVRKGRHI